MAEYEKRDYKRTFKELAKYIIPFIIGLTLTNQLFFLQHTGIWFLTDFEHEDFKSSFKNHYSSNKLHSYEVEDGLKAWIKNTYIQQNSVRTTLEVPNFVKIECKIDEPEVEGDKCRRYIIPAGSMKQLSFNITIEENPPKQEHEFCLVTERLGKWLWFNNKEKTCIDVTIN